MKISRRAPPKRHSVAHEPRPATSDRPKVLSSDEKRELIHAHTEARQGRPSGYGLGYYIAVGASCLVVVSGWWLTLDTNLRWGADRAPDRLSEDISREAQEFREAFSEQAPDLKNELESAKRAIEQAKLVIEEVKASNSTSTKTSGDKLNDSR